MEGFMRKIILLFMLAIAVVSRGQNLLVNGDFETNAPTAWGDNTPVTLTGWTLGSGNNANLVQVDGGTHVYLNGPDCDATLPCLNIPQHYLDIAGSKNTISQRFTTHCEGQ